MNEYVVIKSKGFPMCSFRDKDNHRCDHNARYIVQKIDATEEDGFAWQKHACSVHAYPYQLATTEGKASS